MSSNFKAQVRAIWGHFKAEAVKSVNEANEVFAKEAEKRCPVDTGALQDSIEVHPARIHGDVVTGSVTAGEGLDDERAIDVEYGNHNEPADPFFRPARNATMAESMRIISDGAKKALG